MESSKEPSKKQIEQFSPSSYNSIIKTSEIRPKISEAQIISALKKIGYKEVIKILPGNIAETKEGKINYRVCTQTPDSPKPWYSISESKLAELDKQNIDTIVCIFFADPGGNSYKVRFKEWKKNDIQKEWSKEKLYRWNPSEEDMERKGEEEDEDTGVKKGVYRK